MQFSTALLATIYGSYVAIYGLAVKPVSAFFTRIPCSTPDQFPTVYWKEAGFQVLNQMCSFVPPSLPPKLLSGDLYPPQPCRSDSGKHILARRFEDRLLHNLTDPRSIKEVGGAKEIYFTKEWQAFHTAQPCLGKLKPTQRLSLTRVRFPKN